MSKTIVIYHRADFDGIFCREIARKFLGDTAEYIGWDYGDPLIPMPADTFYILDLSPECVDGLTACGGFVHPEAQRLIWIDHHKSAIEKFGDGCPGYRIDGVSACRLTWQWFLQRSREALGMIWLLPDKKQFVDRAVEEPLAVRLAGEYDIWDKRDPRADVFQLGLRSKELSDADWSMMLDSQAYEGCQKSELLDTLLANGALLQKYQQRNDSFAMQNSFIVEWEGLKFLALNTQAKSSLAFASKDVPETGHDALLKFSFNGKIWDCSMYHAKHNTGTDLSLIAVKHGGGGHRGACGFRIDKIPFI